MGAREQKDVCVEGPEVIPVVQVLEVSDLVAQGGHQGGVLQVVPVASISQPDSDDTV
jgi:hypothetical protein